MKSTRPVTIKNVHGVFGRWLGEGYDLDAIDAVLAAAAVEKLDGDPLWLLLISGPGGGKTETIAALEGAGAIITSSITSEGALLSATPRRDKQKDATGGLLRRLGDRGVLGIKDVTTILSMNRETRAAVLAASIMPIDDIRSRAAYRLRVAQNLVARFVTTLSSGA